MKIIEIVKYPDRKKKAIVVYDYDKPNVRYVIGYINQNEELFMEALKDSKHVLYVGPEEVDK